MPQVSDKDVAAIKDWLAKESTLPKNFDDNLLKKFIFSCDCSLERTKRCIEVFCTSRATLTEIYTNRDIQSAKMKTAFDITNITLYSTGVDEILIYRLTDSERFEFYDVHKSFTIQADKWLMLDREVLPKNHIVIVDIGLFTLKMLAKANIFFAQKFLVFLLEGMPIRLSHVHVVNCPSYTEYMYGLIKGVVPEETREIIHFHTDHMPLHKFIDKKYLPSEYGGDAGSMVEQHLYWIKEISKDRKFYLNDDLWKADISQKVKNGAVDTTMSGSFRTFTID